MGVWPRNRQPWRVSCDVSFSCVGNGMAPTSISLAHRTRPRADPFGREPWRASGVAVGRVAAVRSPRVVSILADYDQQRFVIDK